MVYVLNIYGNPLMPCKEAKARKLLKQKKAKVIKRTPYTIQLNFECENKTQEITLGVDAGSKTIGLSATTIKQEVFSSETILRDDIVGLLATRRELRRTRRNKLRYRKPRFLNRAKSKSWVAPSIKNKINTHLKIIADIYKILPITKIIVEVASFDIQKINNPNIKGDEYQKGNLLDFWNMREYVLFRDGHSCKGKNNCKNKILNVHHIESRKTGGDAPNNLITLCESCHQDYHKGILKLYFKRGQTFKDASFMGVMRWEFYNQLKEIYKDVSLTYGYITKNTRITNGLPKEHRIDAYCITGNTKSNLCNVYFFQKKVRCHNRQIHKANLLKNGKKKANQAPFLVKGFRLFDKVSYEKKEYFIFGRRSSGFFDIRNLEGDKINNGSVSFKKITLLEKRKSMLIERRMALLS